MTTLLVSEIFPPRTGGSGRWFWEVYRRLPREEYLIAAGVHEHQEEFDRTHDLRVIRLPLTMRAWGLRSLEGLRGYARGFRRLRRLIKAERVTRLHCARALPEGVMALALRWWLGVPYVVYTHGEDVGTASTSRELSWLTQRVMRGARFIIANSRNTQELLCRHWNIPVEHVRQLYPGVDTQRFVPAARDGQVRAGLGWGERPVLLTVGRLQKRKGHDQLIRALPAIRERFPDVLYSIIGDGEERAPLEALVRELGLGESVQFRGEVGDEDMIHCYQQCDLFVLPNRKIGEDIEGFGMVLLEAQACGRPVLAGRSGGTAETMRIPETGRVVDCNDPVQIAAAVTDLLSDPARLRRMGEDGRRWVEEQFDWAVLARRARDVFEEGRPGRNNESAKNPVAV